jgi:hypothetical protein
LSSERETTGQASAELSDFVCRFLDRHGAVVEERESGLDVLVPERLLEPLGTPEFIHLETEHGPAAGFRSDASARQTFSIAYGAEFLERVLRLACAEVPVLSCQLDFHYIKSQGFDALVRECFQFKGGLARVDQWAKVLTHYMVLTCRYRAQSDEQKEGLCELAFHLETGAQVPDLAAGLGAASRRYSQGVSVPKELSDQLRKVLDGLKKAAGSAALRETAGFQESLNRKFRRDVSNLEEYYRSLEREMRQSLARSGLSDQLVQDRRAKIALIPEELARKKDDLFKKYSIRIAIVPCAVLLVATPAVKVLLRVAIGRKQKAISAFYNPVTKTMDPLVCEGCQGSATQLSFCDRAHLLCLECTGRCPVCRRGLNP